MQKYNKQFYKLSDFEQKFMKDKKISSYEIIEEEDLFPDE